MTPGNHVLRRLGTGVGRPHEPGSIRWTYGSSCEPADSADARQAGR
jgi:hypothetical protein